MVLVMSSFHSWEVGVGIPLLQNTWDPEPIGDPQREPQQHMQSNSPVFPEIAQCRSGQALGAPCWPQEAGPGTSPQKFAQHLHS